MIFEVLGILDLKQANLEGNHEIYHSSSFCSCTHCNAPFRLSDKKPQQHTNQRNHDAHHHAHHCGYHTSGNAGNHPTHHNRSNHQRDHGNHHRKRIESHGSDGYAEHYPQLQKRDDRSDRYGSGPWQYGKIKSSDSVAPRLTV